MRKNDYRVGDLLILTKEGELAITSNTGFESKSGSVLNIEHIVDGCYFVSLGLNAIVIFSNNEINSDWFMAGNERK